VDLEENNSNRNLFSHHINLLFSLLFVDFSSSISYGMSDNLDSSYPLPPLISAEAVMKEINARRSTHQARIESAKIPLPKALEQAKQDIKEIEESLEDEEACFKLQRTAKRVVCNLCCC